MRPRPCLPWLVVLLLSCYFIVPAAQAAATLAGTVSDSFAAALPGVSVTLTDSATGEKRTAKTDALGAFRFEAVKPGHYSLEIAAAGFSTLRQDLNVLPSQESIKLDLVLHLLTGRGPAAAPRLPTAASPNASRNSGVANAPTSRPGAKTMDQPPVVVVRPPVVSAPRETEAATAPAPPPPAADSLPAPAPTPGLGPTMTDDGNYVQVKVFYATDRQPTGKTEPAAFYGFDRGPDNRFALGTCDVSIPRDHRIGQLESPKFWKLQFRQDPGRDVVLLSVTPSPEDVFYRELSASVDASSEKKAFVFVHGYYTSFEDAARRTAQLAYDLRFQGVPIFYSWPSKDAVLDYAADEATIDWVRPHLKYFLKQVARRSNADSIYLVAHSMGNRILTRALSDLAAEHPGIPKSRFKEVVLAAPDVDAGEFRQLARKIESAATHITLYASSKDKALVASKLFHDYARAGESGDHLLVVQGIDTIDVSAIDTGFLGHSYVADNSSVITDIFYLLSGVPVAKRACLTSHSLTNLDYWLYGPPGTATCPVPLPTVPTPAPVSP
ncbi:MAG TPA: alpha/beta hydrolase [Candidatus Acidoferrum sp.]|nr:alpha/beta hydrolase [Candidatus Acidoferrum sp.]